MSNTEGGVPGEISRGRVPQVGQESGPMRVATAGDAFRGQITPNEIRFKTNGGGGSGGRKRGPAEIAHAEAAAKYFKDLDAAREAGDQEKIRIIQGEGAAALEKLGEKMLAETESQGQSDQVPPKLQ